MTVLWKNWAGNQRCLVDVARPTTEHELCAIVARAAESATRVKAVGAGHSFSDAALTDGTLVDLSDYRRILSLDADRGLLTVQAGARVRDLSEFLWTRGLAFENLGDLDEQTIAGATSTATHGTGTGFGGIATGIVGMRIIDGAGGVHDCSSESNPELLRVARVGLGAIGVVSTLTIAVVPAYRLHAIEERRRLDSIRESFDALMAGNDHFEFFCVPHTGWALTKTNHRNSEPPVTRSRWDRWRTEELRENLLFGAANRLGALWPSMVPRLAAAVPSKAPMEYNEASHAVFATPRRVRFTEMEYALPLEATMTALDEVRDWIDSTGNPTMFPIEVRSAAADDIPLSTANGRSTGYIAVRCYRRTPNEGYFRAVESIMAAHDGRPHWGKLHYRSSSDLRPSYPEWDEFQSVRTRMDPHGVFENAYTRRCLGPLSSAA